MDREFIGKTINIAIVIAALAGIIYPAFFDPNTSLTQIIISLFHPDLSFGFVARWLVVIIFLASLYAFIVGRMYRQTPITILSSVVEIKYLDPKGERVRLTRTQTLRANQRRVTAFFNRHATSTPNARIPRTDITVSAFSDSVALNNSCEIHGQESRSLEVMHLFGQPLPYAWFMPIMPLWLIGHPFEQVPKIFRKYVVKRTYSMVYENEFNIEPVMQFQADVYPSHNLVVTIDFSASKMPPQNSIKALRIKNSGVVTVQSDYLASENKIVFRLNSLQSERLRISWPIPT